MKKSGFIFAEAIIVIAILSIALLVVYKSFNTALINEKDRFNYDDTAYIYRTYYIEQILIENGLDDYYEELISANTLFVEINCNKHIDVSKKELCDELITSTDYSSKALGISKIYLTTPNIKDITKEENKSQKDLLSNELVNYIKTIPNTTEYKLITEFKEGCEIVSGTSALSCKYNYASIDIKEEAFTSSGGTKPKGIVINNEANMIPIMWDGTKWVKADETNNNETYKWYDYENLQWANIVLVKETGTKTREEYKTSAVGTAINENDILAYYVYIPRYKYQLWNTQNGNSNPEEIKIEFQNINDPKENGTTNGTWLTHPAFTFGSDELNGIWVGKFETSADTTTTCYTTPSEANCDKANGTITPRVKPNVDAWKYINLGRMFDVAKYFQTNAMYGISSSTIDSHMMKNMEWGAVAYLSHSKYGKWGNETYSGAEKEIYINNVQGAASTYKTVTGCSGGSPNAGVVTTCPVANTYEKSGIGTGASTTGTIYGVYDMSGGVWEYTMGNIRDNLGQFYPSGGVFSTTPETKYYDSYAYDASSYITHGRGLHGDATKETLVTFGVGNLDSWYSDFSYFPNSTNGWFNRGGKATMGANAGVFSFSSYIGSASFDIGFRSVLVK